MGMSNLDNSSKGTAGQPAASSKSPIGAGAIASLVGVVLLVILMLQNRAKVPVHVLFWSVTWPMWLFGLLMAVVGALVWFGLGVMRRRSRRKARRS
jgi:uncharacterized integral membrane protein